MKDFIKNQGVKLLIIIFVLIFMALIAKGTGDEAGFLTNAIGNVREPIQRAVGSISELVGGLYSYIYKYDSLEAENDSLRIQLYDAQRQVREAKEMVEENTRFRELLNFSEKHVDYVIESAKIVSWTSSNWESSFSISKGTKHGIEKGDAVISEYGAFVGQVTEVGESWATVSTVIDVATGVGSLIGVDNVVGMVVGDYELMQKQYAKITYIMEDAQMFIDDEVVTSGKGGSIPQGLIIGRIKEIETEASGLVEYGVLEPACAFSELVQVFIIKDFEIVE